jgi:hypothetical protein
MRLSDLLESRRLGLGAIAGLFTLQSIYEYFFCGGGLAGFWLVTAILAVPVVMALGISGSAAAVTMCAVLVPFILWANAAECRPYQGGGAAMAYVVVFLYGVPASIACAVAFAFVKRKFDAAA